MLVDTTLPQIVSSYYNPAEPISGEEVTITVRIIDDVGVSKVYLVYHLAGEEPKSQTMEKYNSEWFTGTIDASDVRTAGLNYWIIAEDFAGNMERSSMEKLAVLQGSSVPKLDTPRILPATVFETEPTRPFEELEVISMKSGDEIKSYQDKILIRNVGDITVDNIRLILSSEISRSFKLSDPTIKSIEPNADVTVSFELNGNPNRDMIGSLVGYEGELMVVAEHHRTIILPVKINSVENFFFYDLSSQGWYWTSNSTYPNMFSFSRNAWVFYFKDTTGPREFVDLVSGEFFNVD
jgi:hypothetical protein